MIHQYVKNDNNIILDVGSGSIHLVDDITYDILEIIDNDLTMLNPENNIIIDEKLLEKYNAKDIASSFSEIITLYNNKKLYSDDDYRDAIPKLEDAPIKAICLHVAHDCNLRCKYCFASTGGYDGNRALMSFEVGKEAIDFLIANSGKRKNLEVDFFGGEPLMNFEVVKKLVDYSKSLEKKHDKNFRFTMTTNALLLDEKTRIYLDENMHNIVLSLDGRKQINDDMRQTINGLGSYDIIIDNIKEMVKLRKDKQYYVRGTFTKNNLDFSKDVIDMYNQGFNEISVEPVITTSDEPYALSLNDIKTIKTQYDDLANEILELKKEGKKFNFFHFNIDLTGGPCIIKRLRGCGAGNEYVAITPEGDIYPCHQFVGKEKWKMGNLFAKTLDLEMKAEFSKHNIYTKDNCEECWAKFYCSGGCLSNSLEFAGDISKTHEFSCRLEKARVETAIMMKVEEAKTLMD